MKYKGYALTNFTCAAHDLSAVQECYTSAVDLAMNDPHFDKLGIGLIEDIFYLKSLKLLGKSPREGEKPFTVREIPANEPE